MKKCINCEEVLEDGEKLPLSSRGCGSGFYICNVCSQWMFRFRLVGDFYSNKCEVDTFLYYKKYEL